jgi:integrase
MSVRKKIITTTTPEGEQEATWWIADYTDGAGRRHQVRFKRKADAVDHEEKSKVAIRAGTHVSLDSNLTIADVADQWIKRVEANARERATVKQYREHIKLHIVPRIGAVKLAKFTKGHVEGFRDGLVSGVGDQHKALSRPMAHKVLRSLKSMLKVVRCSHLADDVKVEISKRGKRKLEVGRDIPTPEEVSRMVQKTEKGSRLRALLMMASSTGLRASELRGLRWSDVDLKVGELHVRQRADRWNKIGPPKSEAGRRAIPLGPALALALKEWKLACPKSEHDLVFPTSTGAVDHHKNMLRSLGPVMKAAGVVTKSGKPKYAMHSLRHFFASWCINPADRGGRELSAKVVQTLLGHSGIQMTLDVYGHLFRDGSDRAELAASEKALFGGAS